MKKEGLVAFFDILGYQDIINNNLIEEVAKIISETLIKLPDSAKVLLLEGWHEDDKKVQESLKEVFKHIEYRVISDSILVVCEIPEEKDAELIYWSFFMAYTVALLLVSFDKGLPLRGAMDHGEFFLDSNCFAGKPIINCYRLSNRLELSGCVLTEHCEKVFEKIIHSYSDKVGENAAKAMKDILKRIVMPYLVPLKGGEEKLMTLVWRRRTEEAKKMDVRQYIVKSFQAHNKDVSINVFPKIDNTEVMIRCFMERLLLVYESPPIEEGKKELKKMEKS